jgi:hypothetical protein
MLESDLFPDPDVQSGGTLTFDFYETDLGFSRFPEIIKRQISSRLSLGLSLRVDLQNVHYSASYPTCGYG